MIDANPWVVIPTYNEHSVIQGIIAALFELSIPNLSVLIVDDNSPDGTADMVRQLQRQHHTLHLTVRPRKNGLGRAYIHGFQYVLERGATAIIQMDADFSHSPSDVPRLLSRLHHSDVVIGSRYLKGSRIINWAWHRLLLSRGANIYARVISRIPIKDLTGGFKAWRATLLQSLDLPTIHANGYGFQIVTNFRAWRSGARLQEIPIVFAERQAGASKMNRSIIWEALWLVLQLRLSTSIFARPAANPEGRNP